MLIHPILQKLLADPTIAYIKSQPAEQQRQFWEERSKTFYLMSPKPKVAHEDITIQARTHNLQARLFTPKSYTDRTILFFHGGGWSLGSINTYQLVCDYLADQSQCRVLSVDYRLAPEHKFPSALEDAIDSFHWLKQNAHTFDINPQKIIVMGDSSGGNLTAVLTHLTKDEEITAKAQVLWYPVCDADYNYPSKQEYTDLSYMLDRQWIEWFYQNYAKSEQDRYHAHFSPIYFENFDHLPPALMILPKLDPLYDEGCAYAEKLEQAGNKVDIITYSSMIHGFIGYVGVIEEALDAIKQTANWINRL